MTVISFRNPCSGIWIIVLPGSVQEAHANPCAENEIEVGGGGSDFNDAEGDNEAEVDCEFYGPTDIEE